MGCRVREGEKKESLLLTEVETIGSQLQVPLEEIIEGASVLGSTVIVLCTER